MNQRKTLIIFSLAIVVILPFISFGQRVLSEARLVYTVTALPEKGMENLAEAFANTTQTVWLRGNLARVDFYSPMRQQSTLFDATTGNATILRESGEDKYQWNFDAEAWKKNNDKWNGAQFSETGETLEISGFFSKKIIATLRDGSNVSIYLTAQIVPLSRGYDALFATLEGIPVQYEMIVSGLKVIYTLQSVQSGPVGASRFDIPTSGYKIIKAQ